MKHWLFLIISILFLQACQETESASIEEPVQVISNNIKYAQLFSIVNRKSHQLITVRNPWKDGGIYKTYALVNKDKKLPSNLPKEAIVVRTPIQRIATLSATHIGMLNALNRIPSIIAHGKSDYVYHKTILEGIQNNKIALTGGNSNLNVEVVLELQPEALMTSAYESMSSSFDLLEKAGIPIIYNAEWKELSPLGRTEWIKFVAAFYEMNHEADSIFKNIEQEYLALKNQLEEIKNKPKVMLGYKYKGTWYMPGGQSYMAALLRDADADYHYYSDASTGSLNLSFEEIIEHHQHADIWLKPGSSTQKQEVIDQDARYAIFDAYKNDQMFNVHARIGNNGANDYWETGVMEPHIILADLRKILHPNTLPNHVLKYYRKMD